MLGVSGPARSDVVTLCVSAALPTRTSYTRQERASAQRREAKARRQSTKERRGGGGDRDGD